MRAAIDGEFIATGGEDIMALATGPLLRPGRTSRFGISLDRCRNRPEALTTAAARTPSERTTAPVQTLTSANCTRAAPHLTFPLPGEVSERLKEHAWKVCVR